MDPLSITASIIAVVTAACQVSNGLIKLTVALKEASEIVMALQNEVNDIQVVVSSAQDVLHRKFSSHNNNIFNASPEVVYVKISLDKAKVVLDGIQNYFQSKLVDSKGEFSRMRFLKERSKLVEAKNELREIRMVITNRLELVNLGSTLRMETQMDLLESVVQQGFQAQAFNFTNGVSELNQKMDKLSVALHARLPAQQSPSTQVVHTQSQAGYQRQNGAVTLNLQRVGLCDLRCRCTCHSKRAAQTPAFLSRFIGRLFIGYSNIPSLSPSCDIPTCRRATGGVLKLQYVFPEWFISSILTMEARVSQAPEILIRTWNIRIRSWADGDAIFDSFDHFPDFRRAFVEERVSVRDVDAQFGYTVLHIVLLALLTEDEMDDEADEFFCNAVAFLLSQGADLHAESLNHKTPYTFLIVGLLQLGITAIPERFASLFPERHAEIENFQLNRIHKLVLGLEPGNLEEELRRYDGTGLINKSDKFGRTPLHWAVVKDDSDLTQLLLTYGADPTVNDAIGYCALHYAKSAHILEQCLKNCQASRLQHIKSMNGDSLLEHFLFSDFQLRSQYDSVATGNLILKADANILNITSPDSKGFSPLMEAISTNKAEITKFLLDAGSDYNKTDDDGQTAAMVGLQRRSYGALAVLFGEPRKFDFTIKDKFGDNILHFLMKFADLETLELVRAIVFTGIDVGDKNNDGETARDVLTARINLGLDNGFFYSRERDKMKEVFHSFLDRIEGSQRISLVEGVSDSDGEADTKSLPVSMDTDEDDEFHDALESSNW
ncbi:hypothetical protein TWF281_003224 [Arthrobotrys megalospora]